MYAEGFEGLQIIPILVITPLVFLGGSFYSINMLPEFWQKISLLNPVLFFANYNNHHKISLDYFLLHKHIYIYLGF